MSTSPQVASNGVVVPPDQVFNMLSKRICLKHALAQEAIAVVDQSLQAQAGREDEGHCLLGNLNVSH